MKPPNLAELTQEGKGLAWLPTFLSASGHAPLPSSSALTQLLHLPNPSKLTLSGWINFSRRTYYFSFCSLSTGEKKMIGRRILKKKRKVNFEGLGFLVERALSKNSSSSTLQVSDSAVVFVAHKWASPWAYRTDVPVWSSAPMSPRCVPLLGASVAGNSHSSYRYLWLSRMFPWLSKSKPG